ncbi:hypothetical protein [Ornithinimicrobium cerasi]|uniref:Uncharacterized protein n=1 Tax=Ornithinimicrobium cerasi TaxID=2248773 RepID=A0A285VPV3_9MICO|nr:hypothetical protein [Ornithinimicrobium cerasi]SOC56089.1 hypothetical protein SAMN05421879_106198 [Ornithinimicrobium cerasi]
MTEAQQTWREPDADLIRRAMSRLGDLQHRRVFYEKLENPLWVDALDREGVFDSPPELVVNEDGTAHSAPWPEGSYLIRMASSVPGPVARILHRTCTSTNPYVRQLILRAAMALPPDHAAPFAKPLAQYLEEGSLAHAREVVDLAERLAESGHRKAAMRLLQGAFRPRAGEEAPGLGGKRTVKTGLERYWFEDGLPDAVRILVAVQPEKALTTVVSWLEAFMTASGEYVPGRLYDLSHIWRPSIAPHEQNQGSEELGDALIDAVRDLGVGDVLGGRDVVDVVEVFERNGQPLSQRIALHVLAVTSPDTDAARDVGFERLLMPALMDSDYRHEYARLARAILPLASEEQVEAWGGVFDAGPHLDDEKLAEAAEHWKLEGETLEDSKVRYREVWRLKLLSAIGRDSLPPRYVDELASLEERYGVMDHAEFPSYSTSWVGPTSPVTEEDLMSYGVAELIEYLRTWRPGRPKPWDPSKEGLARALQAVVAKRSEEFSAAAAAFANLEPTYVRALFSGLSDALKNGEPVVWDELLVLAASVAVREDDGSEVSGSMDEDLVWRFAQRSMAALIEQGTRESGYGIPAPQLVRAVDALEPLVSHADPTVEHEERYGGSNMDPLTLSLNTTRPAAMRALIRVAARVKEIAEEEQAADASEEVVSRVLALVDARLQPEKDPSLAEAAAIGEGFGRLVWVDRGWTIERLSLLLSADAFGDVIGSTALATYQPSRVLLEVLSPWARTVLERVARGEDIVAGWRRDRGPVEVLGDHLMMLRLWDAIPPDDELLTLYFEQAPVEARAKVLGHLGWLLGRSDDVPEGPLRRAMDFLDARVDRVRRGDTDPQELDGFYWWARSAKFPPQWWLPRLEEAVRAPGFNPRGMLGEVLEENASLAPASVARILEQLLIHGRNEPFGRYDLIEHAPGILAIAYESGDGDAVAAADRVMDLLGRAGHVEIGDEVSARRQRE